MLMTWPYWFSHEDRNEATERYQQHLKINILNRDKATPVSKKIKPSTEKPPAINRRLKIDQSAKISTDFGLII